MNYNKDIISIGTDNRIVIFEKFSGTAKQPSEMDRYIGLIGITFGEISTLLKQTVGAKTEENKVFPVFQIEFDSGNNIDFKLKLFESFESAELSQLKGKEAKELAVFERRLDFDFKKIVFVENIKQPQIFDSEIVDASMLLNADIFFVEMNKKMHIDVEKMTCADMDIISAAQMGFEPIDRSEWRKLADELCNRLDFISSPENNILINGEYISEDADSALFKLFEKEDAKNLWNFCIYEDEYSNCWAEILLDKDFTKKYPKYLEQYKPILTDIKCNMIYNDNNQYMAERRATSFWEPCKLMFGL